MDAGMRPIFLGLCLECRTADRASVFSCPAHKLALLRGPNAKRRQTAASREFQKVIRSQPLEIFARSNTDEALLICEWSNLPCEFQKWSNFPVKFLRSKVVKFSL